MPKNRESPFLQEELKRVLTGRLIEEPKGILEPGTEVRLKSGSQGWIKATIVEYYDVIPAVGGVIYGGGMTPGYKVHILEGKHAGDTIRVPMNYVEPVKGSKYPVHPSSQSMGPYRGIKGSPKTPGGGIIFGSQKPYTPSPWR